MLKPSEIADRLREMDAFLGKSLVPAANFCPASAVYDVRNKLFQLADELKSGMDVGYDQRAMDVAAEELVKAQKQLTTALDKVGKLCCHRDELLERLEVLHASSDADLLKVRCQRDEEKEKADKLRGYNHDLAERLDQARVERDDARKAARDAWDDVRAAGPAAPAISLAAVALGPCKLADATVALRPYDLADVLSLPAAASASVVVTITIPPRGDGG